jgi:phosphate transport system permease protein
VSAGPPPLRPGAAGDGTPAVEIPRRPLHLTATDYAVLAGSAVAGLALAMVIFGQLLPVDSPAAVLVLAYAAFLAIVWRITTEQHGSLEAKDRIAAVLIASAAVAVIFVLGFVVISIVVKGLAALRWNFFTQTQEFTAAEDPLSSGGAAHAIVGSFQQVLIAMVISVPLGIATAVFLNEVRGWLARPVRFVVDAMSGVPSIVAGLFIYVTWLVGLGNRQSGFAAALALSILMLPSVTRTSEEVLRLVPGGLREAALALGASQARSVWLVVLPTARLGVITAVILGVARAVGETAPLIMTSGGSTLMEWNPLRNPQASLPLYVFRLVSLPGENAAARAWTGALVLIVLVLSLFTLARLVAGGTLRRRRNVVIPDRSEPEEGLVA